MPADSAYVTFGTALVAAPLRMSVRRLARQKS